MQLRSPDSGIYIEKHMLLKSGNHKDS